MGSSLVDGNPEDNMLMSQDNNLDSQVFLPDAERARGGMQLEQLEDQPLNLQQFIN